MLGERTGLALPRRSWLARWSYDWLCDPRLESVIDSNVETINAEHHESGPGTVSPASAQLAPSKRRNARWQANVRLDMPLTGLLCFVGGEWQHEPEPVPNHLCVASVRL